MCPFYNAQLFEITGAAKGVFTHSQSSCHTAKVVLTIRHVSRQIPLAARHHHTFPHRGFLVWGFLSRSSPERQSFVLRQFLCSISKPVSSSRPGGSLTSSRAGAVKVGRRATLAACSGLARPYLDSSEHDGTLGAIGMTIRGEPAFG